MENKLSKYPYLNDEEKVYVPKYALEEFLSKYWYEKEYDLIDKNDKEKSEKSRADIREWIENNIPRFCKDQVILNTTKK